MIQNIKHQRVFPVQNTKEMRRLIWELAEKKVSIFIHSMGKITIWISQI